MDSAMRLNLYSSIWFVLNCLMLSDASRKGSCSVSMTLWDKEGQARTQDIYHFHTVTSAEGQNCDLFHFSLGDFRRKVCSTALEKRVFRGDRHSGACDSFPAGHPTLGLGEGPALCLLLLVLCIPSQSMWGAGWAAMSVLLAAHIMKKITLPFCRSPGKAECWCCWQRGEGAHQLGKGRHRCTQITCPYPQPWDARFLSPTSNHSRFLRYHPNSIFPLSCGMASCPSHASALWSFGRLNLAWTTRLQNHSNPTKGKLLLYQKWSGPNSSEEPNKLASLPDWECGISQFWTWSACLPVHTARIIDC